MNKSANVTNFQQLSSKEQKYIFDNINVYKGNIL